MNQAPRISLGLSNTASRYGIVAQTLHWLIVALVIVQFISGIEAHGLPVSLERLILLARHKSIGISIFVLMLLRLGWRIYSPPPRLPENTRPLVTVAARASHGLLYALLLLMPPVGWLLSSASNLSVSWFGWVALPNLLQPDRQLAYWLLLTHQSMAWLLLALIALHVAAALWHHFMLRDGVLLRMLPFARTGRKQGKSR